MATYEVQIEITTRCNFQCWYCAGRSVPQEDMSWEMFKSIVDTIPFAGTKVTLQGEGEPTLHPKFWEMAAYVRVKGHVPFIVTNGSRIDALRVAQTFPTVTVSLDTLDQEYADSVGRVNLPKVLENISELLKVMTPQRVTIKTVDTGQDLGPLKEYVSRVLRTKHVIVPLLAKDDYAQHYPSDTKLPPVTQYPTGLRIRKTCSYVATPRMRFYTLNGKELPCCFIKDDSKFTSVTDMALQLRNGDVPAACTGCFNLQILGPIYGNN